MKKWHLFIDDERFPPDPINGIPWTIARNFSEVVELIVFENLSIPNYISFDHDLGDKEPTGMICAKYLVLLDMRALYQFPDDFDYYIHSQNPIGKINIEGYLESYMKHKNAGEKL